MTPRLTFSLLCDKNRFFIAKRVQDCHISTNPKKERKKESVESKKERKRESERYRSLPILLKLFAANAAIIQQCTCSKFT